tara:strand:- start:692 stop:994 length:303 start_codon:yes stop_codon:yes gene_type:complete
MSDTKKKKTKKKAKPIARTVFFQFWAAVNKDGGYIEDLQALCMSQSPSITKDSVRSRCYSLRASLKAKGIADKDLPEVPKTKNRLQRQSTLLEDFNSVFK